MAEAEETLKQLRDEVNRIVVGQAALIDGLLIGLLAGGHVLVEGVPGLAKTTAVRTLAEVLGLGFRRIQFTPDLLPGDVVGTPVYRPDERRFEVRLGPVFTPVLLSHLGRPKGQVVDKLRLDPVAACLQKRLGRKSPSLKFPCSESIGWSPKTSRRARCNT